MALALNNLKRVDMPLNNQTKPNQNLNWIVWNWTVYMYKIDLALNNLQWLICHKTEPNQTKPNQTIPNEYIWYSHCSGLLTKKEQECLIESDEIPCRYGRPLKKMFVG